MGGGGREATAWGGNGRSRMKRDTQVNIKALSLILLLYPQTVPAERKPNCEISCDRFSHLASTNTQPTLFSTSGINIGILSRRSVYTWILSCMFILTDRSVGNDFFIVPIHRIFTHLYIYVSGGRKSSQLRSIVL